MVSSGKKKASKKAKTKKAKAKKAKAKKPHVGRTIVIGDVHGCARELGALLDKLGPVRGDRVFLVGDLVMRGPEPNTVLRMVREVGGIAVRGNHEWRLTRWRDLQSRRTSKRATAELSTHDERILANKMLRATAAEIDDEGWAQIESMPLWLEVPEQELLVVHAGLVPGVPLGKQLERDLLHIRGITKDGAATERRDEGVLWGKRYEGPTHVVFGHNANAKPQLHRHATGIDTGCVYGGRLTALVLPEHRTVPKGADARKKLLVSVKARRTYQAIQ
ncbi:MAG: metallophosphoesterase [Deltaproteobacteria bacterium]|nr:metallophosphoesterase [Deltaproteobacteria bacterium]